MITSLAFSILVLPLHILSFFFILILTFFKCHVNYLWSISELYPVISISHVSSSTNTEISLSPFPFTHGTPHTPTLVWSRTCPTFALKFHKPLSIRHLLPSSNLQLDPYQPWINLFFYITAPHSITIELLLLLWLILLHSSYSLNCFWKLSSSLQLHLT